MKIRFSYIGISIEGAKKVPTASELCKMDKRLIYVGTVTDKYGKLLHDAFLHVLEPTELFTIEKTRIINDNLIILDTEKHRFDEKSPILKYFYDNYSGEIYVGDVCDGSGRTGEVWHDTYKMGLSSNTLYTKNEDGTCTKVNPPVENCFSVPDRYGFRIVVKTPNQPEEHYAFFWGISAFNKWTYLMYHAKEGQQILHSLDPDYTNFLYGDECKEFKEYPKLVKAYPKCHSNKGFLKLDK